jgi:hypothetical protein
MALPTVTGVAASGGSPSGGDSVVITGTNFNNANVTSVHFGGANAPSFTIDSGTQITAVSPVKAGVSTVDITVTNPSGTSVTSSADLFTYGAWTTPVVVEQDESPTTTAGGAFTTKTPAGLLPTTQETPLDADYPLPGYMIPATTPDYAAGGGVSLV